MLKKINLKYIILIFIGLVLVLFYYFVNPNKVNYLLKCPLYATTGIYCPGCGSQRATHALLHLNFVEMFKQNLLYFFAILLLVYHLGIYIFNNIFNKKYTSILNYKKTPVIILIIVIIFWILRNLPWEPFNLLAPHL